LDHIFIKNVNECNIEAGVLQTNITDHFSTILSIENENKETGTKNSFKMIDYKKLNEFFNNEKWIELLNCNDVNECVNIFLKTVIHYLELSTTVKKINSKNKRLKEWMTAGLLCSVRRKQELSLKVSKHPNNIKLASYYKNYKNKFTTILRAAKTNYFKY
jgi:hypothetical protein